MGDFIEPGTHRSTNIKVKIETLQKNQKCILVIALNPKILYMRFLTAQLNRTLMKKNHKHEGYSKMHKISGNFDFSQLIFVLNGSSLHCNVNKTC